MIYYMSYWMYWLETQFSSGTGMILKYTKTKTFSKVILTGLEAFSNLHESHLDFVLLFVIKHYWDEFIHCNLN